MDNKTVYEHFQSLYMPQYDVDDVGEDIDRLLNEELHIIYDELNYPFTVEETLNVLNVLKNGKSPGEDLITYELMKFGKHILAEPLTRLFNHCYEAL